MRGSSPQQTVSLTSQTIFSQHRQWVMELLTSTPIHKGVLGAGGTAGQGPRDTSAHSENVELPDDDFVLGDLDQDEIESTTRPIPMPKQQRRKLTSADSDYANFQRESDPLAKQILACNGLATTGGPSSQSIGPGALEQDQLRARPSTAGPPTSFPSGSAR